MSDEGSFDARRLSIVIPAYNEEDAIADTLHALQAALPGAEIIVVNDCSTDRTGMIARAVSGVIVKDHPFNRGYGAGLKTGMRAASRPLIAWFDADGEMRPADLVQMCTDLDRSRLAAVIGLRSRIATSHTRTVGKFLIRLTARALGLQIGHDINCGLRVFRREAIRPYVMLLPDGFSASTTSTMIMAERGYPVAFHPVSMNPRIGHSKVRLRHAFGSIAIVLRTVMLFAPLRIFLALSVPLLLGGAAYGAFMAVTAGRGVPTLAVLLIVSGGFLFLGGLLADQISQLRLSQLRHLDDRQREAPSSDQGAA
ncbi:MAG: glycosyltransferase family 2 protein [Hyphomonadaceae bacterium]|nr:glycosyltransferase family 2 protein [Hyphomonadaceae bacterium]